MLGKLCFYKRLIFLIEDFSESLPYTSRLFISVSFGENISKNVHHL